MKKITESQYVFLSFNILVKAAKNFIYKDFENWVHLKPIYNKRINRLSAEYFHRSRLEKDQILNKILNLSIFLRSQFKIRTTVLYRFHWIKYKKIQVLLCFFLMYIQTFKILSKSLLSLAFKYQHPLNKELNSKIILTIGFPFHAFNYHLNPAKSDISSFGEYLFNITNKDNEIKVISLNEYIRQSKKNEKSQTNEIHSSPIPQNERYFTTKKFSLIYFINNLLRVIILWATQYRTFSILSLNEFSLDVNLIPYLDYIEQVERKNKILTIFILPWTVLEFFQKYPIIKSKVRVFFYSDNYFIPPAAPKRAENYSYNDLNVAVLSGYCSPFGLTGNIKYLYHFVSNSFAINKKYFPKIENEIPCVIGYERLLSRSVNTQKFTIAVFDVPAELPYVQLKRSIFGDITTDINFVSEFLNDILDLVKKWEITVLFKPKYSLSNSIYDGNYRNLIKEISVLYPDNFEILDPYVRLADIVDDSNMVISFPYTSTCSFSLLRGKPSYFYIPAKFYKSFLSVGRRNDCLYGTRDVEKILINLAVQIRRVKI